MELLDYTGAVESWKAELIAARAKLLGFKDEEIPEAQQAVILDVVNFKYDEEKSNGAEESTPLVKLIDNRLKMVIRSNGRHRVRIERAKRLRRHLTYDPVPAMDFSMDVRSVMESLSAREQRICEALGEGRTYTEIAALLKSSWQSIDRAVRRIRTHFIECGIELPKKRAKVRRD